jgi:hypothetical protein
MDSRAFAAVGLLALVQTSGCGSVYYAVTLSSAAARVEEAREIGAEQRAPYEYYFAKAHLDQARVEASEASYGDAANFAEVAEDYAQKAIEITQGAQRRGAQ